ncbi:MAG TPA: rod shape-determining protein MreD [Vicinamibacterales bacterium]|nr:rod shape-determining protein MreD [Vicinamibacterales bacterium]
MKAAGIILAIVLALALQTTIARFFVGGRVAVDLVLVVVVYVALSSGPVAGLMTGTVAGLTQDALSTGVIGIGGLAKTIVGFVAGVIGTQLNIAEPVPRFVVFFAATVVHQAITIGLGAVLGLRAFGVPYAAVAGEALANAVVGVAAFQLAELLPGAVERRRMGRGRLRR